MFFCDPSTGLLAESVFVLFFLQLGLLKSYYAETDIITWLHITHILHLSVWSAAVSWWPLSALPSTQTLNMLCYSGNYAFMAPRWQILHDEWLMKTRQVRLWSFRKKRVNSNIFTLSKKYWILLITHGCFVLSIKRLALVFCFWVSKKRTLGPSVIIRSHLLSFQWECVP